MIRGKRGGDYHDIAHEITLYAKIGLAILKFKLDAKKLKRHRVIPQRSHIVKHVHIGKLIRLNYPKAPRPYSMVMRGREDKPMINTTSSCTIV